MKVAFDNQVFVDQKYGGTSRYIFELAQRLDRIPNTHSRIFAPIHRNGYLDQLPVSIRGRTLRIPFLPNTTRAIKAASLWLNHPALIRYDSDVLHRTYYNLPAEPSLRAVRVLTVYDMIHERFAGMFPNEVQLSSNKRAAVESSDHVVCISKQTQVDLVDIFGIAPEKTSVVYLGFEAANATVGSSSAALSTKEDPYLLYVGSRSGYKNFDGFLRAYSSSAYLKNNFRIVCFGGGALTAAETALVAGLGLNDDRLVQVGGDDAVLHSMYAHAALFVYPSLYEGFGIPPLEAMSAGCPVVCSSGGSIPEIVEDAAIQFDADRPESIRAAMERVLMSESLARDLIQKGHDQCRKFSWDQCAAQTRAVYATLL